MIHEKAIYQYLQSCIALYKQFAVSRGLAKSDLAILEMEKSKSKLCYGNGILNVLRVY